jgi:hypothetical protein
MIGLEGVRLLFIGYFASLSNDPFGDKVKSVIKRWMIYIPGIIGIIYWRIFVFESTRQAMNVGTIFASYSGSKLRGLLYTLINFSTDMVEALFAAWFVPLYGFFRSATYWHIGMSLFYALIAVAFVAFYYWVVKKRNLIPEKQDSTDDSKMIILIGLITTMVTILPMVLAGRNIYFSNQFDRYTLQATIGIALFMVGLIVYSIRPNLVVFVLFFLVGLGVATHYHNGIYHQEFWQIQQELWWQISWRAPDIADDTVLILMLPADYRLAESYETWGPANIIYRPESEDLKIQAEVLSQGTAQKILRGADDEREQRGAQIVRDFKKVLIASMPTTLSCVNVIDGRKYELSTNENPLVVQVAPYSQIDFVDPYANPSEPPISIFGTEPDHDWCYYYQKISLARQESDWNRVAALADQAFDKDLKPLDLYEWMPVYEGYANTDQLKKARQISKILQSDKDLQFQLCTQLEDQIAFPDDYNSEYIYGELCLKK